MEPLNTSDDILIAELRKLNSNSNSNGFSSTFDVLKKTNSSCFNILPTPGISECEESNDSMKGNFLSTDTNVLDYFTYVDKTLARMVSGSNEENTREKKDLKRGKYAYDSL